MNSTMPSVEWRVADSIIVVLLFLVVARTMWVKMRAYRKQREQSIDVERAADERDRQGIEDDTVEKAEEMEHHVTMEELVTPERAGDECGTCGLAGLADGEEMWFMSCGHRFHEDCFIKTQEGFHFDKAAPSAVQKVHSLKSSSHVCPVCHAACFVGTTDRHVTPPVSLGKIAMGLKLGKDPAHL